MSSTHNTDCKSNAYAPLYLNGSHGILVLLEEVQSLWKNIIVGIVITFCSVSFSVCSSSYYYSDSGNSPPSS